MNYQKNLHRLLEIAINKNASDVHISVGRPPVLRTSMALKDIKAEPRITSADARGLAFALMNSDQQVIFFKEKDIDLAYEFNGKARFRANIFFQSGEISIALRVIPSKIKTIEQLNLPPILHHFASAKQGFFLLTGATSQGKTTTLAALVEEINHTRYDHIITIEEPIEYRFFDDKSLIDQREVGLDTPSFARALKSTLREDPDVIMVGELRDLETISTAITAAETGHLVLATLHTHSTSQTINRLIDVFPPHQQAQVRSQLATSLLGVASQRLLPRIKNGFIPAMEVMVANAAVANLIRESKVHEIPTIIETSSESGMMSFNQSLTELVKKGEITKESALEYSSNPSDLQARL